MRALIHDTRVCQIEREPFPIAPPLTWVECDESITTQHTYVGGRFVPPNPPPAPIVDKRQAAIDALLAEQAKRADAPQAVKAYADMVR